MSTIPGVTLESLLMWNYDLIVGGDGSANLSLQIVEALGGATKRREISEAELAPVVALFEPYRRDIENRLGSYNEEENGSWRDFSQIVAEVAPDDVWDQGQDVLSHPR